MATRPHLLGESAFSAGLNLRFRNQRRVQLPRKALQFDFSAEVEPEPEPDAPFLEKHLCPSFNVGPDALRFLISILFERSSFVGPSYTDSEGNFIRQPAITGVLEPLNVLFTQDILLVEDFTENLNTWASKLGQILEYIKELHNEFNIDEHPLSRPFYWIDTSAHPSSDLTDVSDIVSPTFVPVLVENNCDSLAAGYDNAIAGLRQLNTIWAPMEQGNLRAKRTAADFDNANDVTGDNCPLVQGYATSRHAIARFGQSVVIGTEVDGVGPPAVIINPLRWEIVTDDYVSPVIGDVSFSDSVSVENSEAPEARSDFILITSKGTLRSNLITFPPKTRVKSYVKLYLGNDPDFAGGTNPNNYTSYTLGFNPPVSGDFDVFLPLPPEPEVLEFESGCVNTLENCEDPFERELGFFEKDRPDVTALACVNGTHIKGWQVKEAVIVIFPQYEIQF